MAVRILESTDTGRDMPIRRPATVVQTPITASGTSAQSAAFAASTRIVTVQADEAVHVKFGSNPTATTSDHKIAAGGQEDFAVEPNESKKVAVITA